MTTSRSCPLCPQVMETCQVSRSPRERRLLLLLLLLLVPWGTGPASGVALPLTAVFSLRSPGRAWADLGIPLSRRSLALADDAAFRERARLLAALERRRWLDSYMQKLLLLDAP
ncbi:tuberoinfundibular peptide of 39 residues [Arvicola amphibius]|uniref:tuberoinfundibular peptide of 39 residues n=1 Tax=Arvicola amphibius TaxID=1047088 RepID=UPI0018E2C815|nr:tuberoinfundibular peptide of 39 residues [Arvicola amphibius]